MVNPKPVRNNISFGIDLGFKTSATAVSILLHKGTRLEIVALFKLGPYLDYNKEKNDLFCRNMVLSGIKNLIQIYDPDIVIIEKPMFQGKNNENFLRFFGIFENVMLELGKEYLYIAPTTVKKQLGGGKLDKDKMAENCKKYFANLDKHSHRLYQKVIRNKDWDVTDSIAICIAGLQTLGIFNEGFLHSTV